MAGPGKHRTASAVVALTTLLAVACNERADREAAATRPTAGVAKAKEPPPASSARAALPSEPKPKSKPSNEPTVRVVDGDSDAGLVGIGVGRAEEVGPAGPVTATPDGVVFLTKDERLLLSPATNGGRLDPVTEPAEAFAALGRGPAVSSGKAYWVSRGRLVRAQVGGGPVETLAEGAREGSRVAALSRSGLTVAAYLTKPDAEGTAHAKLWLEGGRVLDLTPDGAGASSVALAETNDGVLAVSIDGRSGMTPLHARRLRGSAKDATLSADVVSWVAGPAQTFTEVFASFDEQGGFAFLPIERDATHFGLASVELGREPAMDARVVFLDYPNGLNLSPVAATKLCGHSYVAFVRPKQAEPGSAQELMLAEARSGARTAVADALGFASVSLSATPAGGIIAYVADRKTFAHPLTCRAGAP
jgi:hypothetical protein